MALLALLALIKFGQPSSMMASPGNEHAHQRFFAPHPGKMIN
jgi:hypothetical protein